MDQELQELRLYKQENESLKLKLQAFMFPNGDGPPDATLDQLLGIMCETFDHLKGLLSKEAVQEVRELAADNIIQFPVKVSFECPDCKGSGLITAFAGRISGQHSCPRCDGSGKIGAK